MRIDIKSESQIFEEEAATRAAAASPAQPAPADSSEAEISEVPVAPSVDGDSASAAPEAETAPRCAALLSSGERCTNPAKLGSEYCGIPAHQKQAPSA